MMMGDDVITTQLDILRHGECEGGHIFRGHTDVPLTLSGFDLMQEKCQVVNVSWDTVVTSPLKRCSEFAYQWSSAHNLKLIYDDALREMDFGLWDGQKIEDVWKNHESDMQAWSDQPADFTPPEGEPLVLVAERVKVFLRNILNDYAGQKILIITHGGIVRILLSLGLGMHLNTVSRFDVPYGNMSRLTHFTYNNKSQWQLSGHNIGCNGAGV